MDDFLHNLRTGNTKAYDRGRRQYEGNRFKPNDRQNIKDKRRPTNNRTANADQLALLKKPIENLAETNRRVAEAAEQRVKVEERKAAALEKIVEHLTILLEKGAALPAPSATVSAAQPVAPQPPTPAAALGAQDDVLSAINPPLDAEDRVKIVLEINRLRDDGMSYEKIAQLFEQKQVPTLSGRGKWRGQTIFRLSKEMSA